MISPLDERPPGAAGEPPRILPSDDVFLPDEKGLAPAVIGGTGDERVLRNARPPGPGLPESLLWMLGMPIVQVGGFFIAAILFVVLHVALSGDPEGSLRNAARSIEDNMVYAMGIAGIGLLIFGILAVALRTGPRGLHKLGLRPPSFTHGLLILVAMFPLTFLCSEVQTQVLKHFPGSDWGMGEMFGNFAKAPFPIFLIVIALLPALSEELLFRGLIGRGLVARWGFVRGVLITSVLFGVVHMIPAQAIAVIPLGIAMHYVYLTTRSFWAPVALHFLNNAFAAVVTKYGEQIPFAVMLSGDDGLPPQLLGVSVAVVTMVGVLLWQTRVKYTVGDAGEWSPGYPSAENPPQDVAAVAVSEQPRLLVGATSSFCLLSLAAVIWRLTVGE